MITNRIVQNYLLCRRKAYLVASGQTGTPHEYEVLNNELRNTQTPLAQSAVLRRFRTGTPPNLSTVTLEQLKTKSLPASVPSVAGGG